MISWCQIKPVLRGNIGLALRALGFENPGTTMWRHRAHFVDVVHFNPHFNSFSVEFGCSLRSFHLLHPKPWETMFRSNLENAPGRENLQWRNFAETLAEEQRNIQELIPLIVDGMNRWFAKFENIASAREAVERNQRFGPDAIGIGNVGSPNYHSILAALNAVS